MAKAELKTKLTTASVKAFLDGIKDETRRKEAKAVKERTRWMAEITPFVSLPLLLLATFSACRQQTPTPVSEARMVAGRYVIDVRTDEEWQAGHLEGAMHIPYDQIGEHIGQQIPDKKAPIALYCRSGHRAGIALETLQSLGYEKAENYGSMEQAAERLGLAP